MRGVYKYCLLVFCNSTPYLFLFTNQILNVCTRNTGSVEVSGSIPLGPPITRLTAAVDIHWSPIEYLPLFELIIDKVTANLFGCELYLDRFKW